METKDGDICFVAETDGVTVAVLFCAGDMGNALSALNITEETASAALPSVQTDAAFDYGVMAMNVIVRLFAMLLHIGLTVVVYYGVVTAKKICLPAAIILHMLMDTFSALYQRSVVPLWSAELWDAIWAGVVVFIAVNLYRKMNHELRPQGFIPEANRRLYNIFPDRM